MKAIDIPRLVQDTCQNLAMLKQTTDAGNIDEEEVKILIQKLQAEANNLTREVNKTGATLSLDAQLITNLTNLLKSINVDLLGHQQALFLGFFKRINNALKKFESRVTKAENDPLR